MTALPTLAQLEEAADVVYRSMPPTPQYRWPLLCEALGTDIWVKHENHTPTGAFKIRGGLAYFDDLARSGARLAGVVSATRGNHGHAPGCR
jgi:threonine dehydratase